MNKKCPRWPSRQGQRRRGRNQEGEELGERLQDGAGSGLSCYPDSGQTGNMTEARMRADNARLVDESCCVWALVIRLARSIEDVGICISMHARSTPCLSTLTAHSHTRLHPSLIQCS